MLGSSVEGCTPMSSSSDTGLFGVSIISILFYSGVLTCCRASMIAWGALGLLLGWRGSPCRRRDGNVPETVLDVFEVR